MRKRIITFLLCSVLSIQNSFSATSMIDTQALAAKSKAQLKIKVENCKDFSQYFKIINSHANDSQFVLFLASEKFAVESELKAITEFHDLESDVYKNTFTKENQPIYTGELHLVTIPKEGVEPLVEALCGLTFACDRVSDGYMVTIETNGARCSIDGYGVENAPYVVEIDSVMKK